MTTNWAEIAQKYWDDQPHPHAPSIRAGDYATAVKLATMSKFGGHASPQEAELFWHQFKTTGLSPGQYEETLHNLAPHSFVFHGRPPSMSEVVRFSDGKARPAEIRQYYHDLPDKHYPEVPAGEMVKHLRAASGPAQQFLGRAPVKYEASILYQTREDPVNYFRRLAEDKAQRSGIQDATRRDAGGRSTAVAGRPPLDQ